MDLVSNVSVPWTAIYLERSWSSVTAWQMVLASSLVGVTGGLGVGGNGEGTRVIETGVDLGKPIRVGTGELLVLQLYWDSALLKESVKVLELLE